MTKPCCKQCHDERAKRGQIVECAQCTTEEWPCSQCCDHTEPCPRCYEDEREAMYFDGYLSGYAAGYY